MPRQISSKLIKQNVLRQNQEVATHIPETRIFSLQSLRSMLARHETVFLKPVVGTGGLGVIQVRREGGGWLCKHSFHTRRLYGFTSLRRYVDRLRRGRRYLIQQGIALARINGRPVDYRVKIIKSGPGWRITAMVGRLARPGLVVTNLCRGGTQLRFADSISRSLNESHVSAKRSELRRLTHTSVSMLERAFPGIGQLGFDYGIDVNGRSWILEVNTRPH